jgi:hypothetical protein
MDINVWGKSKRRHESIKDTKRSLQEKISRVKAGKLGKIGKGPCPLSEIVREGDGFPVIISIKQEGVLWKILEEFLL